MEQIVPFGVFMKAIERIIQQAQQRPMRIALSETHDERVLDAARRVTDMGLAQVMLVGDVFQIQAFAQKCNISMKDIKIICPKTSADRAEFAEHWYALRKKKGLSYQQAWSEVLDPLTFANLMVKFGRCDGTVNGAEHSTSQVVRRALQIIGPAPGCELVSSFFIMMLCEPFHYLKGGIIFSDCGLVIEPSSRELASIAISAASSARELLMVEPKLAMLSFSTNGSAKHESVDKVRLAAELVTKACPEIAVDQDVQLDAAIVEEIAARKLPTSKVKGQSNVLIFPNLESGNIGYKLAERLGGAVAIGPLLQGLRQPANDLSRGCSVQDIIHVIAVTVVQAQRAQIS